MYKNINKREICNKEKYLLLCSCIMPKNKIIIVDVKLAGVTSV